MNVPGIPANEHQRLRRLNALRLLDTGPDPMLDGFGVLSGSGTRRIRPVIRP